MVMMLAFVVARLMVMSMHRGRAVGTARRVMDGRARIGAWCHVVLPYWRSVTVHGWRDVHARCWPRFVDDRLLVHIARARGAAAESCRRHDQRDESQHTA